MKGGTELQTTRPGRMEWRIELGLRTGMWNGRKEKGPGTIPSLGEVCPAKLY